MKERDPKFVGFVKICEERGLIEAFQDACVKRNVRLEDVFGQSRQKAISRARHACWYVMRQRGASYPEIGDLWGRDHTTVLSAVRVHELRGEENAPKEDPREWASPPEERKLRRRVVELEERVLKLETRLSTLAKAFT